LRLDRLALAIVRTRPGQPGTIELLGSAPPRVRHTCPTLISMPFTPAMIAFLLLMAGSLANAQKLRKGL